MAKKIQLQDASGNVLHPLTLGECVTMDNGENLDTLMSKSQMFTPTIAQDKSMFKVGTGVDVDYSANVKDGAYESLMFKGKSLVNLCPNGMINYTATSDWDGYNGIGQASNTQGYSWKTLQDLKPNTKYFISCYVETFDVAEGQYYLLNNRNDSTVFGDSLYIRTTGLHKWVLTSKSEFTEAVHIALRCQNAYARGTIKIRDIMIIEYQEGMEEWDIPYFEGICDVKMPILRNVGKNLFSDDNGMELGAWSSNANPVEVSNEIRCKNKYIPFPKGLKNGDVMRIVLSDASINSNTNMHVYNENKSRIVTLGFGTSPYIEGTDFINGVSTVTVHDVSKCKYFSFRVVSTNTNCKFAIMVNTSAPYEDHKTNILRTSEEIVLRSLPNGVCDTYNTRTGEYVKRIGEKILNGSESWNYQTNYGSVARFNHVDSTVKHWSDILCDKMIKGVISTPDLECINIHSSSNMIQVQISTDKLSENTATGFKQWLSQNPLTVQYELAEPVTTIVKPSTMTPFAYQNGHVIVESGFEGQSLLPEIEYSVVTGRTGQVTQNTKVLRQQEQQIIGLEELLLTQVVQMEYERTLLQFDYELQMMMLG